MKNQTVTIKGFNKESLALFLQNVIDENGLILSDVGIYLTLKRLHGAGMMQSEK